MEEKFEIGDLVIFVDRTGERSKPFIVIDIDDENGKLTANREDQGKFQYSINAAFGHFFKHISVRNYFKKSR